MFGKRNLFYAVICIGLIWEIYALFHSVYIASSACPIWDERNEVCRTCDYPEPVQVNTRIQNHCLDRKITKEPYCGRYVLSVPKEYTEEKRNLFVNCGSDRTLVRIQNTRSIIFILGAFLCLIFIVFKKTRWSGVCAFSALSFFSGFVEFFDCWTSLSCQLRDSLAIIVGAGFIALLPISVIVFRYLNKKITKDKLFQKLFLWFLMLCIPLVIYCWMFPVAKGLLVVLMLWLFALWRFVLTKK